MRFEEVPVGSMCHLVERVGGDSETLPSSRTTVYIREEGVRDEYGFVPATRLSILQVSVETLRTEFSSSSRQSTKVHWATPVKEGGPDRKTPVERKMRDIQIIVSIERGCAGNNLEEVLTVSVPVDATEEEIERECHEEAETLFFNTCNYGWSRVAE